MLYWELVYGQVICLFDSYIATDGVLLCNFTYEFLLIFRYDLN